MGQEKHTMVKIDKSKYAGNFLKASDLDEDSVLVKIKNFGVVEYEFNGEKQVRDCLYMEGYEQPLGLNKTNLKMLVELFGDETEAWKGKAIRMRKETANNPQTGQVVDTIRIKPYEKKPTK